MDVELPGFKKDEIQLELNNGYLTITAERAWTRRTRRAACSARSATRA